MGQLEIFQWLKSQWELGNFQYFSIKEVIAGLKRNGQGSTIHVAVTRGLLNLSRDGFVERKPFDEKEDRKHFTQLFRVNPKVFNEKKGL